MKLAKAVAIDTYTEKLATGKKTIGLRFLAATLI